MATLKRKPSVTTKTKAKARPVAAKPKSKTSAKRGTSSKQAAVLALLRRNEGAKLEELMSATNWQAHSVRGFLSGTVKKKLGLKLVSERIDGERRYRITQ